MTSASARDSIVRKFTNYRNTRKKLIADPHGGIHSCECAEIAEGLKTSASAIFDLKSFTKGRSLFKERKNDEILDRRDQIMEEEPSLPQIAAYQKALKQLWVEADQDWWEAQAVDLTENIYKYVLHFL